MTITTKQLNQPRILQFRNSKSVPRNTPTLRGFSFEKPDSSVETEKNINFDLEEIKRRRKRKLQKKEKESS